VDNRRRYPRQNVSIETRLFLPSAHPKIVSCRIVDVSESGVKIQIDVDFRLPARLVILRAEHENMYDCRTAWQFGRTAGLSFLNPCSRAQHLEVIEAVKTARIIDKDDPSLL
jgi:hypothetical protein